MRLKKIITINAFLLISLLFAQEQGNDQSKLYNTAPGFFLDYLNYSSEDSSKTRVDIFIQLPYSNLQFIKDGELFKAEYTVTLTVYDEDKDNIISNRVWDENVTAQNFNQTSSQNNFNLSLRTFDLDPGEYLLRCVVEDKNSTRSVTSEHNMEVLELTDPVSLSDILLIQNTIESETGKRIVPNISQSIQSMDKIIEFYYEVYSDQEKDVTIVYNIKDKNENQNYSHQIEQHIHEGKNELFGKLQYPSFTFGEYELSIRIKDSSNNFIAGIGKTFYAKVVGMPRSVTDLNKAVDQMMYITTSQELNLIREAEDFEEKLKRYLEYWKEKDPTPSTAVNEVMLEYYRRVDYSNRNFKAYKNEGWRTDMGMIYITLGPPDHVDRHPFAFDSKPYEIWDYYNINRRFVFVDHSGFGDYRLTNRDYRDWNRYRY